MVTAIETVIETRDLCKNYALGNMEVKVLKEVNLAVNKGEFVSIMGPSGSGKSTLLYILGSLERATSGKVKIKGRDISTMKDKEESVMRRREIGFVFQFYNLVPNLTVEENVLLPLMLDGKRTGRFRNRMNEILNDVGLSDKKNFMPGELSGGQQQRVAIARGLINDPGIILADEPIGNLDTKTGTEIMKLFQKINKERNKTIIQVTHSMEASNYGDRVINIKDGGIIND